jgi:hypothetical protein
MKAVQDWDHKAAEKAFAFVEQSIKAALASLEAVSDTTSHERWCDDAIASKKLLEMALLAVNGDYFGDPDAASNEAALEEEDPSTGEANQFPY